ncbi:unnamed protein product [Mucor hiemalis]
MPSKKNTKTKEVVEEEVEVTGAGWVEKMNQAIDDLSESRTSTREESLAILTKIFSCHHVFSHIENRIEEILGLLKKSVLKNNSVKEACFAARAIELVFVNMDDISEGEMDDLYRRILPSLRSTIKNSEEIDIKTSCLHTLSLITYIAASDIDKQLLREYLFDLIETDGADFNVESLATTDCDLLFAEALKAYGILFAASFSTGFVDFDILWEEVEKVMPAHEMMLESSDKNIRIAAGENIALMFEIVNIFLKSNDDEEDEEEDNDVAKPEYDNMDGLIHTLKDLSVDSNRRRAKSDRVEQKSVFRDIVKTVEENIRPEEELKIGGRVLVFRGWAKILPLSTFRKCLGQGFQHHLKTNAMMKEIFRYSTGFSSRQAQDSDDSGDDEDDGTPLSNVDRKYMYDENKKSRSKQIRNARLGKESNPDY